MTFRNKCSKFRPSEWAHARTRLIMGCRTLSKVLGGCEWFDRHRKYGGEMSLHFDLELPTPASSIVPTGKTVSN